MLSFLLHIIGNAIGLYLAARFIQGVSWTGDLISLLTAGALLGVLNVTIRPITKILSAPLILLTLGLFIIIINFFILWLLQIFMPELIVQGFWAYFWTLMIITGVNYGLSLAKRDNP